MKRTFWQFNVGHAITIFTVIFTIGTSYGTISTKITDMQATLNRLADKYDELENRMNKLQYGKLEVKKSLHGSEQLTEK